MRACLRARTSRRDVESSLGGRRSKSAEIRTHVQAGCGGGAAGAAPGETHICAQDTPAAAELAYRVNCAARKVHFSFSLFGSLRG